jgi:retron-type reverse transcriptase
MKFLTGFDKICSFENLHLAYLKARMNKRYRKYVLEFSYNLEENLLKLQQELISQTYKHGKYREFIICDSKKRKIKAAPFPDRVVHHALCNLIEPIFDKGFIFDSFACRKEKGTHKAIKRLQTFLNTEAERERERERGFTASNATFQSILIT